MSESPDLETLIKLLHQDGFNCASCKHWGVTTYQPGLFTMEGVRDCERIEKALDQDGEPCTGKASLGTPPDFFCCLWERKEE